jgi:sugar phosphate permease
VAFWPLFAMPALIQGFMRPTIDTYVNQHTPSATRATVLSVSSLVLSVQVAFFEPIVGFITDDVSIQAAFAFVAVFFMLVMPPLFFLWRRAYIPAPEPLPAVAAAEAA